jgi:dGTPase
MKVAQVARSLGRRVLVEQPETLVAKAGGLDLDVVESASLAHDLGHPPFGHVAEKTLNRLLTSGEEVGLGVRVNDGFDGNAQSFRIVTKLAVQQKDFTGLNLTRATLNGILKYPWRQSSEPESPLKKWGVFDSELDDFAWCTDNIQSGKGLQTLEAALMDWADDITYAVHDMEDFFRAGLIPLERFSEGSHEGELEYFLENTFSRLQSDDEEQSRLREAFMRTDISKYGVPGPFRGSQTDRAALRTVTSSLIRRYVSGTMTLQESDEGIKLQIDPDLEDEVKILKELTWTYVIESTSMVAQRFGHQTLIESLFRTLYGAAQSTDDRKILPQLYRDEVERSAGDHMRLKRIVADLISSMSEAQVVAIHQRLTGQSLGSAMDAYLQ